MAEDLVIKIAGLRIPASPLLSLTIELTPGRGFVITFITEHQFSSQILEQCVIGQQIAFNVGKIKGTGTVDELEIKNMYSRIVIINTQIGADRNNA